MRGIDVAFIAATCIVLGVILFGVYRFHFKMRALSGRMAQYMVWNDEQSSKLAGADPLRAAVHPFAGTLELPRTVGETGLQEESRWSEMKLKSTCLVCGKVFEKASGAGPDAHSVESIAESMVSYLARRHSEKTGHATSAVVRDAEDRLAAHSCAVRRQEA